MIPGTTAMTNNSIIEKYCHSNNTAKCDIYGGLYQWNEIMEYSTAPGVQGICPVSWHLPTDPELTILTTFLGGASIAGGKMKSTGTIEAATGLWHTPNAGATNSSGFSGLPCGNRGLSGSFTEAGLNADFWSSTQFTAFLSIYRNLFYNSDDVNQTSYDKNYGFSVRCVKD
jgi:uncharacterized protein (TIGR02145 family)